MTPKKIVTWNCNLALRKKLDFLLALDPDVAVVQECERVLSLPEEYDYFWVGENPNKGLGVLIKGTTARMHSGSGQDWTYFLPVELASTGIRILATWAFNRRAERVGAGRVGNPLRVVEELDEWLRHGPSVMVGDFNNSVVWDRAGKEDNFAGINKALNSRGLRSAYHGVTGDALGQERQSTFFHQKNPLKGFHIDYCYVHHDLGVQDVFVPDFGDWRDKSDHVPVVTTLTVHGD